MRAFRLAEYRAKALHYIGYSYGETKAPYNVGYSLGETRGQIKNTCLNRSTPAHKKTTLRSWVDSFRHDPSEERCSPSLRKSDVVRAFRLAECGGKQKEIFTKNKRGIFKVNNITVETLQAFSDAWNRHDIDALMSFMSNDCIFETAGGPEAWGTRHSGPEAVRKAFEAAWQNFPDAQWNNGRHFVFGDHGVSEWTFTGTAADGRRIEANGVDIFTFRNGKIHIKNAFRKDRPLLPAKP